MSKHIKCARCGSLLSVVPDDDGRAAVHPCVRCSPHPTLMSSAEDFAELRERVVGIERGQEGLRVLANAWVNDMQRVDRLAARVTALEMSRAQTMTEAPERWSELYGVRSTPRQVTQTGGTGEEGA